MEVLIILVLTASGFGALGGAWLRGYDGLVLGGSTGLVLGVCLWAMVMSIHTRLTMRQDGVRMERNYLDYFDYLDRLE